MFYHINLAIYWLNSFSLPVHQIHHRLQQLTCNSKLNKHLCSVNNYLNSNLITPCYVYRSIYWLNSFPITAADLNLNIHTDSTLNPQLFVIRSYTLYAIYYHNECILYTSMYIICKLKLAITSNE